MAQRRWLHHSNNFNALSHYERAMADEAFDIIRNVPILETQSAHFLKVLGAGSVATNVFLRRINNFALDMGWLPWPVLPKKQWPKIRFKEKRAVTALEHQAIVAAEKNRNLTLKREKLSLRG